MISCSYNLLELLPNEALSLLSRYAEREREREREIERDIEIEREIEIER